MGLYSGISWPEAVMILVLALSSECDDATAISVHDFLISSTFTS